MAPNASPGTRAMPDADMLSALPEELLLQVFGHLTGIGQCWSEAIEGVSDGWLQKKVPFRAYGNEDPPHPGMRAYPFLGQVCKKWKNLLNTEVARGMMWKQLVVDFGHELVTAIHTPLKWSNQRPSTDEFTVAFQEATLSANKIVDFVLERAPHIQSLVLCQSEGFWGEDGDYLSLTTKHNFQSSHLGFMLAAVRNTLTDLRIYYCNDLVGTDSGVWSLAAQCVHLKSFVLEGVNHRLTGRGLSEIAKLKKLETLTIQADMHDHMSAASTWLVGLDTIPQAWSQITTLKTLELRGHGMLDAVPLWLKDMPNLRTLDVSNCTSVDLMHLPQLTQLETLVMQRLHLTQEAGPSEVVSQQAKKYLPDLGSLRNLRALCLATNHLTRLPEWISRTPVLEVLDVSTNPELEVAGPLTPLLNALPRVCVLDFRGVHKEKGANYWSDKKCATMKHIADASKALKRRKYQYRVLIDSE